jgi:hypothetical protein
VPARRPDLGLGPQGDGDLLFDAVLVADRDGDRLAGVAAQRVDDAVAAEQLELLALDAVDLVPRLEAAMAAGDPSSIVTSLRPSTGVARRAIRKKIANARTMFMPTPATRIARRTAALARERPRVVGGVAVLALHAGRSRRSAAS